MNRLPAIAVLAPVLALGCYATPEDSASSTANISGAQVLSCQQLKTVAGHIGSGQTAAALATAQLSGTADNWAAYVEFLPSTTVECSFALPPAIAPGSVGTLALGINYRGPRKSDMTWTWQAWDAAAGTWVRVGDNGFARDWVWSAAKLPLPAPAARFISGGAIRVRYGTSSSADASDLDQWVVEVASGAASSPDMGSAPLVDMARASGDLATSRPDMASAPADLAHPSGDMAQTTTGGHWQPHPGTSWQWQLSGTLDTSVNVQVYDIDLFESSAATIAGLKAKGRKVVCYFSAGTFENGRPDSASFPTAAIGSVVQGWPDENWLDTRSQAVRDIMQKRMDLAAQKGCDGVEPDNVDGYTNKPGFSLTGATQLDYNGFLADAAHSRGLAVALKNNLDQVPDLVGKFDFALNEECFQYNECGALQPFIAAGKAVFEVEYGAASLATSVCPKANAANFDTLIKDLDLDAWRVACR